MDTKQCTRCKQEKPRSGFNRRATAHDGLQVWCRSCQSELSAARRASKPEETRAYNSRYRQDRREVCDAATKRWREQNRERVAATKRAWADANPDKVRASRERTRLARAKRLAAWKAANPESVREYQRRRRASGYGGPVDIIDPDSLWERSEGKCGICGESIDRAIKWPDPSSATIDHILALAKGGTHTLENCQWAHLICNLRKGARDY